MSGVPVDLEQALYDAERGWALSTDARMALAAEVRRLRADRLEAKREALREARAQATWPLATAEQWRYDRMLWIFDVMLGEIPEDSLAPPSPSEPGFAEAYPDHPDYRQEWKP